MNKLKLNAFVDNKVIKYYEANSKTKIVDFLNKNDNHKIDITFEIADSPEYFQHKYYRGYLLPDVAFNESEADVNFVHNFILKKKFLYKTVSSTKEIPSKYRSKCIVVVDDNGIKGFLPSTADLTYKEMKDYIERVETYLSQIGGYLGDAGNLKQAEKIRKEAFNDNNR